MITEQGLFTFTEVCNLIDDFTRRNYDARDRTVIYMHVNLYRALQSGIKGQVSNEELEFHRSHQNPKIMGIPVFLTINNAPQFFIGTV